MEPSRSVRRASRPESMMLPPRPPPQPHERLTFSLDSASSDAFEGRTGALDGEPTVRDHAPVPSVTASTGASLRSAMLGSGSVLSVYGPASGSTASSAPSGPAPRHRANSGWRGIAAAAAASNNSGRPPLGQQLEQRVPSVDVGEPPSAVLLAGARTPHARSVDTTAVPERSATTAAKRTRCFVPTDDPATLSLTFILERLPKLERALAQLRPDGLAFQKLTAQLQRLTAELARRQRS